jgi:hypothetical protein
MTDEAGGPECRQAHDTVPDVARGRVGKVRAAVGISVSFPKAA